MNTLLPGLVSLLFLGFGAYVLVSRGLNRVSGAFFALCATTFCWQFAWSILFQLEDAAAADVVARIGYFLILFLPTSLYYFVVELTMERREIPAVLASCAAAGALAALLVGTDLVVAGTWEYRYGFYPRAGPLLVLHIVQTVAVMLRALVLLYRNMQRAMSVERLRLRYCFASMLIYFIAAIDYLCNYGAGFYPPGVLFIALSLGIMAQAIARHYLLANPMMLAATVVHEMRTPLATIRSQARFLSQRLPELIDGYEAALAAGGRDRQADEARIAYLRGLGHSIEAEVQRTNFIADIVLANAREGRMDSGSFALHAVRECVDEALACYPFEPGMRERVRLGRQEDFVFRGSAALLVLVLYNLLKNALAAVQESGGAIEIAYYRAGAHCRLVVTDTGPGIPAHVLPHVFDPFYTTRSGGTGMGLAFCRRVVAAFGGRIGCESREGEFTAVSVELPQVDHAVAAV
ncbi:ATP-binding protein [Pseudoduganella sp. GCM10020061]|uniref:ATP-binding protein n=1 Tax=Pseudoduganella sp. GCM10020061 TaxID=3317345 RepID=UPI003645D5BC